MSRSQTDSIRGFILDCVAESPRSVARQVAEAYGISRQAANRHLDALVEGGALEQEGATRSRVYRLRRESVLNREIRVTPVLSAGRLWDDHIAPVLARDPGPVRDLCRAAFAEVIQNVIRHAHASWINVSFELTARHVEVTVEDDGQGLFNRLAERTGASGAVESATNLVREANERAPHSPASRLLLLARSLESFRISSSGISVIYYSATDSWSMEDGDAPAKGTCVSMRFARSGNLHGSASARPLAHASGR